MRLRAARVSVAHRVRGVPRFSGLAGGGGRYGRLSVFVAVVAGAGFRSEGSGVASACGASLASGVRSGARVWRGSVAVAGVCPVVVWRGRGGRFRFGGGGQRVLWSGRARLRVAARGSTLLRGLGCFGAGCGSAVAGAASGGSGSVASGSRVGVWRFSCLVFVCFAPGFAGFFMSEKPRLKQFSRGRFILAMVPHLTGWATESFSGTQSL